MEISCGTSKRITRRRPREKGTNKIIFFLNNIASDSDRFKWHTKGWFFSVRRAHKVHFIRRLSRFDWNGFILYTSWAFRVYIFNKYSRSRSFGFIWFLNRYIFFYIPGRNIFLNVLQFINIEYYYIVPLYFFIYSVVGF